MEKNRVNLEETYNRDIIIEAEDEEEFMCLEGKIILYNNNNYYGSLRAWDVEKVDKNEKMMEED